MPESFVFPPQGVQGLAHSECWTPARRLMRYCARPPVAIERLEVLPDGRVLYRLKRAWRNGTAFLPDDGATFTSKPRAPSRKCIATAWTR
jgi:hypothetical protein